MAALSVPNTNAAVLKCLPSVLFSTLSFTHPLGFEEYKSIVDQVGKEFNLDFEHEIYKKIIYQNVNNYLAQTETKLKQKGQFVEKPELGNSVDYLLML